MWQKYFKVVGIVPGPVIFPKHGRIDFANPNLDLQLVKELFENNCIYLQPTPLGLTEFYGVAPDNSNDQEDTQKQTDDPCDSASNTDEYIEEKIKTVPGTDKIKSPRGNKKNRRSNHL
jgi:hypothetical protein